MSHATPETDEATRCLDEALEDTFPASDPPSMTSPMAATPSSDVIAEAPGPLRVYRVVEAAHASLDACGIGLCLHLAVAGLRLA